MIITPENFSDKPVLESSFELSVTQACDMTAASLK